METGIYEVEFDEKAFDDLIQQIVVSCLNSKRYELLQKADLLESTKIERFLYHKLIDLNVRVAGVMNTASDPIICNTAEEYIDAAAKYDEGIFEYASAQIWYKFIKQRIAELKAKNDDNEIGKAAFTLETSKTNKNTKAFLKLMHDVSKASWPNNNHDDVQNTAFLKYLKEKTEAEEAFKSNITTRTVSTLPTPHHSWEQFIFKKMNEALQTEKESLIKESPYPFCDREKMMAISRTSFNSAKWQTKGKETKKGFTEVPKTDPAGNYTDWLNRGIWKPDIKETTTTKIYMDSIEDHKNNKDEFNDDIDDFNDDENSTIEKVQFHGALKRVYSIIGVGSLPKKEQEGAIDLLVEAYKMLKSKRSYKAIEEETGYTKEKLKKVMKQLNLT